MPEEKRIYSVDVFRGIVLIAMFMCTDLSFTDTGQWLAEKATNTINIPFADIIITGFLFIAGMAIPLAVKKRLTEGEDIKHISRHLVKRSISLLIFGLLMINIERVNTEFTGFGKDLWAILMFTGVFLVWNDYQKNDDNFFSIAGLKLAGIAVLVFLVFKFRSGEFINNGSLISGWWGYPGILGWGFLVSALIYLFSNDNILNIVITLITFFTLNILISLNLITPEGFLKEIFNVIINGGVPFIILMGVLTSVILRSYPDKSPFSKISLIAAIAVIFFITGLLAGKLPAGQSGPDPAFILITSGISMILFSTLYWIIDIRKPAGGVSFLMPVATHSLTVYMTSGFIYHLLRLSGIPFFSYRHSESLVTLLTGSFIWTVIIFVISTILIKNKIKLRI